MIRGFSKCRGEMQPGRRARVRERARVTVHVAPVKARVAARAGGKDVEDKIAAPEKERAGDVASRVRAKVLEAGGSEPFAIINE